MYKIELTKVAEKELNKLFQKNKRLYKRVDAALDAIAKNPDDGKPLKHILKGNYSYRVGEYRIIYQVRRKQLVVIIIDAGHRREIYR